MRDGLAGPQPAHDVEELIAAPVAGVLVEVIAEGALLVRLAPPTTTLSRMRPGACRANVAAI